MDKSEMLSFVKVVQAGSFTKAAESTGKQKAYLSRVITKLEGRLGVRLLDRTTRSLSLTELGREVYERCLKVLEGIEDIETTAQRALGDPSGTLKISCGTEFGMIAVSSWIMGYLEKYSNVKVEADYTNRVVDIVQEGVDIAIRLGELSDSNLVAKKLGELKYGIYASPSYLEQYPLPSHPIGLNQHQVIKFSGGTHSKPWLLHKGKDHVEVVGESKLKVNNVFVARDACINGFGISKLPTVVAKPALETGAIVQVFVNWEGPKTPAYAVYPSARYMTPKVRKFIDHAAENFIVKL
jgi:LysR family transcriptional regulator, regulator for bpeEF and oprC